MAPKTPNPRLPNPLDALAGIQADIDELMARAAPPGASMFVREVVLPVVVTSISED